MGQIRGATSTSAADVTSPSLLTTEAAGVYSGAGLLSLARVCRISPEVQTDLWCGRALQAAGVSPKADGEDRMVFIDETTEEKKLLTLRGAWGVYSALLCDTPGGPQLLLNDVFHVRQSSTGV